MAISIEWQTKPPYKDDAKKETQMFPRIIDSEVIDEQRLAELIAAHGSLSRGKCENSLE